MSPPGAPGPPAGHTLVGGASGASTPPSLQVGTHPLGASLLSIRLTDPRRREGVCELLVQFRRGPSGERPPAYAGNTIGRYANRIRDGRLQRGGRTWTLAREPGQAHTLHGGPDGWHRRVWTCTRRDAQHVEYRLVSPDGDQGFPGRVEACVRYRVADDGLTLGIEHALCADAPTPAAMTFHPYFNLDGAPSDARRQRLLLRAHAYAPVDAELLPTGAPQPIHAAGAMDFARPRQPDARVHRDDAALRPVGAYDHAWLLDPRCATPDGPAAAELLSADARLRMALFTSAPALHVYDGTGLAGLPGLDAPLPACAGLALEPGFLPDSPNHPEWPQPSCWLRPGVWTHQHHRLAFEWLDTA